LNLNLDKARFIDVNPSYGFGTVDE
jgi:hypothetical protein